jgi:hypothetical protein
LVSGSKQQFLNWLYDVDVEKYLYNGPQGIVWEYDENGEPYVTEEGWEIINHKEEDLMPEESGGGSFQDSMDFLNAIGLQASTVMEDGYTISYRYWPSTQSKEATLVEQEVSAMRGTNTVAEYLYQNDMVAKSTMAVNMIPVLSGEMKSRVESIGEIVRDISWQMVYAEDEETFEALWSDMQEQAEALGMPQVEVYYQNAWQKALRFVSVYE